MYELLWIFIFETDQAQIYILHALIKKWGEIFVIYTKKF
jgi:hypothetical protein